VTNSSLEKQRNKGRKNLRTKGRIQEQPQCERKKYVPSEWVWMKGK
jgi:hypothetical protein